MPANQHDVCIVGGGLAGLTLARQLRRKLPSLDIAVIEHRRFPVREAAHKVGESTVEVAAHYLANELDLAGHLQNDQLGKFGLRLFFRGEQPVRRDLAQYDELGPSKPLPIPTYQLDRGRLENYLADEWRRTGDLQDGTTVRAVDLSPGAHRIHVRDAERGTEKALRCRYLVDASGRRALLRNHTSSGRPARHNHHAVWFRVEGHLDVDAWGADGPWRDRCAGRPRRLSTNHFTGPGYWLWLIPLSSHATSVGLVFDPKAVRMEDVRTRPRLLRWLLREHPLVASKIADCKAIDHHVVENYAIGSSRVFSDEGWATTGDASVFTDPLYSPGGDFVALSNGYVAALIEGDGFEERAAHYQRFYQSFFRNTIALYRGQYLGLGDRDLMVAKLLWDYTFYFGISAKLYFSRKFTDVEFMRGHLRTLLQATALHAGMQRLFRQRARSAHRTGGQGRFYDHHAVPLFHELQKDLVDGDPDETGARLVQNLKRLETVRTVVIKMLEDSTAGIAPRPLEELPTLV